MRDEQKRLEEDLERIFGKGNKKYFLGERKGQQNEDLNKRKKSKES